MKEYESTFVLDPNANDAQVDQELEKVRDFVAARNGEITEVQKWGRRKLAYEIDKKREGIYTLVRYKSTAEVPAELDRQFRLNESMLRYLTVVCERPPLNEGGEEEGAATEDAPRAEGAPAPASSPAATDTPAAPAPAAGPAPEAASEPAGEPEAADAPAESKE